MTTGKQPPKAASRWLLVQSRGRRWSFPFIVGEHEVVVAGSSPTANLPLRGSAPLSFYVKDVSVGLRLVRVHASSLRIDGREVPDSRLLPPSCSLEVDGEALHFSVKVLSARGQIIWEDPATARGLPPQGAPADASSARALAASEDTPASPGLATPRSPTAPPRRTADQPPAQGATHHDPGRIRAGEMLPGPATRSPSPSSPTKTKRLLLVAVALALSFLIGALVAKLQTIGPGP